MECAKEVKKKINEAASSGTPFLFAIDFEMDKGIFIEQPLQQTEVLWRVGRYSNFTSRPTKQRKHFTPHYISPSGYADKFKTVYEGLHRGDTFLINLTARTPIDTGYSLEEILKASNSPYAILLPNRFVCFSPETFVKIDAQGIISSYPMKGTIDAALPNAEDTILADYKESAEHYTIVDLIRSDLSRIATHVQVARMRYIDRLTTSHGDILQVSSEVRGTLPPHYRAQLGDLLSELLPAGSVSGAPKPGTVELIKKTEGEKRGFYCGVFGYFDGTELDTAVSIRFIEQQGDKFYFRSGSGITINSDCEFEYNEINQKIYLPFV